MSLANLQDEKGEKGKARWPVKDRGHKECEHVIGQVKALPAVKTMMQRPSIGLNCDRPLGLDNSRKSPRTQRLIIKVMGRLEIWGN
jgi:hypothetical protein